MDSGQWGLGGDVEEVRPQGAMDYGRSSEVANKP